jgi:hypothetical protein
VPDRDRRQLPGRGAVVAPGAGAPVRQRGRLEAGRIHPGDRRGLRPAVPARGVSGGCVQPRARRRAADVRRTRACALRRRGRQGRVHRLDRGGAADRRALRQAPAVPVPRARWQEPAGGDAGRRPRPGGRGRVVQRVRHGRTAMHIARNGDRASRRARRLPVAVRQSGSRGSDRGPHEGRAVRPDDLGPFLRPVRHVVGADPAPSPRHRIVRDRSHHRRSTPRGLRRRPREGPVRAPDDRRRRHCRR